MNHYHNYLRFLHWKAPEHVDVKTINVLKVYYQWDIEHTTKLHFVINQTPFSSFITIRKKFVGYTSDDSFKNNSPQFECLKCDFESLQLRNQHLEELLVEEEEELETTKNESEETKSKLHNIIDILETKIKVIEN